MRPVAKSANPRGDAHTERVTDHPIVRHPAWCTAGTGSNGRLNPDWSFDGPAEADGMHHARVFHVETGSSTLTVALAQPFEVHEGRTAYVGDPVLELNVRNHELMDADSQTWLRVDEAEQLVRFLQESLGHRHEGSGTA
jgi:hypothetical protein